MVDRRDFLKLSGTGMCAFALGLSKELQARILSVDDPLVSYPDRSWEEWSGDPRLPIER